MKLTSLRGPTNVPVLPHGLPGNLRNGIIDLIEAPTYCFVSKHTPSGIARSRAEDVLDLGRDERTLVDEGTGGVHAQHLEVHEENVLAEVTLLEVGTAARGDVADLS